MNRYNTEFKEEALKLSDEVGVKKAAAQLWLPYYTISDWRRKEKLAAENALPSSEAELTGRVRQLEREVHELRQANDIL